MSPGRLTIEERKQVLKWYWKFENIAEVQREWNRHFGTSPPTRITIARLREKFETDGTVQDVCQRYSGRPPTGVGLLEEHVINSNMAASLVSSSEKSRNVSSDKPLYVSPEKSQYVPPEKLQYVSTEKPLYVSAEKPQYLPTMKSYLPIVKSPYLPPAKSPYVLSPEKPLSPPQYRPAYDLTGVTRENAVQLLLKAAK